MQRSISRATRIRFLSILLTCLAATPLRAEQPVGVYLFPAGAQRGTSPEILIGGLFLNKTCNLEILGAGIEAPKQIHRAISPWFEGPVLPLPESQRQEDYPRAMSAKFQIQPDAKLGSREVRMWTSQGVTAPLKFIVGDLPEIVEKEIAGEPIPVPVKAPVTINGRIFPHEDIDIYTVSLKKDETITCSVDAAKLGSPLQAHLEIRDEQQRRLAESSECRYAEPRLAFTAPKQGIYQIVIRDLRFDGGSAFVYRLTILTGPSVARVFPLGARRGTQTRFEISGPSLRNNIASLTIPQDAPSSYRTRFHVGEEDTNPVVLDVDDLPEIVETQPATDPIKANFLSVPAIGNGRISKPGEIDDWSFSARKGDVLDIELRAARLGSPLLGMLTIVDRSGKVLARDEPGISSHPSLRFTAPQDGLYRIRVQDQFRSRGGSDYSYRLRVDRPKQSFALHFSTPSLTVLQGAQTPLKLTVNRMGGFTGPIFLRVEGVPPGITLPKELLIAANQSSVDVPLKTEKTIPLGSSIIRVTGTAFLPNAFSSIPLPMQREAVLDAYSDDLAFSQVRLVVAIATPFKIVGEYVSNQVPRGTMYTRRYKIERATASQGPSRLRWRIARPVTCKVRQGQRSSFRQTRMNSNITCNCRPGWKPGERAAFV